MSHLTHSANAGTQTAFQEEAHNTGRSSEIGRGIDPTVFKQIALAEKRLEGIRTQLNRLDVSASIADKLKPLHASTLAMQRTAAKYKKENSR
jgi:hypothetical protein